MTVIFPTILDPRQTPPELVRKLRIAPRPGEMIQLPDDMIFVWVLFTQRSGSKYLADLLFSTQYFGQAHEFFGPGAVHRYLQEDPRRSFGQYVAETVPVEARNGFFLAKTTIEQFAVLAWYGLFAHVRARSRFIVIERMDKLGQAVSWLIANQTGKFQWRDRPVEVVTPSYDAEAIHANIDVIVQQHRDIDLFMALNGLVPHHVCYEHMIADPVTTYQRIEAYLGVIGKPCDLSRIQMQRQATDLNSDWRDQFLRDMARKTGPASAETKASCGMVDDTAASVAQLESVPS